MAAPNGNPAPPPALEARYVESDSKRHEGRNMKKPERVYRSGSAVWTSAVRDRSYGPACWTGIAACTGTGTATCWTGTATCTGTGTCTGTATWTGTCTGT